MHRRRIWVVGFLPTALGAAALGVHASSAAPSRAAAGASTSDATYSCRVRSEHFVDLYASITIPPVDNKPQPGLLVLTTGAKSVTKNGATVTVSQVGLSAKRNSLRIDKSSCSRVKRQIPLKPKGLPGPPRTASPAFPRDDTERCDTAARVLVRLRLTTTDGSPTHALLAIRNDNARRRPVAFYNWSPRKFSAYASASCASS